MPTKEKSTFSHFFKDDAEIIQNIIEGTNGKQIIDKLGTATKEILPIINSPKTNSENEVSAQWKAIRSFFRSGKNTEGLSDHLTSVITSPLYTNKLVGSDFPVWVADEKYEGQGELCLSLKDVITNCLYEIAPEESDAHILKANINRIVNIANDQLSDSPQLFQSSIIKILDELEKQLDVTGDEVSNFNSSLKNLKKSLPTCGALLPYTINTSFQLLEAVMINTLNQSRKKLAYDISQLKCRLNDLLRVDREKNPNAQSAEKTKDSLGFADSMFNFDKLTTMVPNAGAESMGEERVNRITAVVKDLEAGETILSQKGFLFVDEKLHNNKNIDWKNLFGTTTIEAYKKGAGCSSATSAFNKNIASWEKLFVAVRVGTLEVNSDYHTDVHDDFFTHFGWENFSTSELKNCPHFIMIADDVQLFETELSQLSAMLSKNIPAKVIAVKRNNLSGTDLHAQTELGALMLSHKNIYVAQSTSITPKYLFNNFSNGLNSFAPAFFNVLNVDAETHNNPYLWTSSAVESRDFPGFSYEGTLGTSWGSRFEVEQNPQANLQYPIHKLTVVNAEGEKEEMEFPFTFADFVALCPDNKNHFMVIDSSAWNENLIDLTDYISNSADDNIGKVPFIWMMDATNELHKVAVSWDVVLATQERLDFWRFLQENSGINNYHVSQAVEATKAEMQEELEQKIAEINAEKEAEIQSVKDEESGKVMENLTSVLLNLDTTNLATTSTPAQRAAPSSAPAEATDAPTEEAPVEEESMLSNDPYIDTALCTSCNECINMNGQLFKYNGDKMAFIADAKAGSFKELVEAAELCPVGIIHPGSPLNADEADLDDLTERAAKFN